MADQKKRSDLIRAQIEKLLQNAPQPYTDAEKEQIAKGRGKRGSAQERQKEIDEGRATIERRNEEIRAFNKQISDLTTQLGDAEKDERTAGREDIENASKKRYDEEASSGWGRTAQLAANTAALPAGFAAGRISGMGVNALADISQESKNKRLQGVAKDRLSGLTTRKGALAAAERSGAMPSNNALLRVGGRMLPHTIGSAGGIAKGASMLSNSFQGDDFYSDMSNRAMGLGLIGSGVGLAQEGARYAVSPGVAPDAQSIAIIESDGLRRGGLPGGGASADRGQIIDAEVVPDAPAQKALPAPEAAQSPAPGSKAYYVQEAKRLGVKGATRKTKADLVAAVNEANKGNAGRRVRGPKVIPGGMAGPAIGAGLAYMATPGDANASTGADSLTGRDEALTNAAAAGGAVYGANRLLRMAPAAMRAFGTGMTMMAPGAAADITDGLAPQPVPDEQELIARNREVSSMPFLRHLTPGHAESYEMAQVPAPNPERQGMGPRADDFDAELAELGALLSQFEAPAPAPQPSRAPMPQPPAYPDNRLLRPY